MNFLKLMQVMFLTTLTFQLIAAPQDTRSYELKYADQKLNEYYKILFNKINLSDQVKLKKAQQQWVIFRDLDCSWTFKNTTLDCLLEHTYNRLKQLQDSDFFDKKNHYSSIEFEKELEDIY